ncbi:MAG: ABC transporter ATP-binding protein [Nitrospinota bacterium]|nr:MAG: ABC transporter ATP-binding protein [Nitrospinota bacterium]
MSTVRLYVDIVKQLASFRLQVSLEVYTEILVLFGPSGAGKTQTLNAIAGLMTPDRGEILLDGEVFFRRHRIPPSRFVPARKRGVGYVFQQYALFPHLTALENVAYALWRQPEAHKQALHLLERMHLAHLAHRYPQEMSGGQQQRVAIARALAARPKVLLLDEPFSALDLPVRERLQRELRDLQQELGLVVIYVTHNLEEAFVVGHRLAVMREGRVEQIGPIEEVFRRPVNYRAAEIMGVRNLFRARVLTVTPQGILLDWDGLRLEAPPAPVRPGEMITAYIRPEDIKVLYPNRPLLQAVRHNHVTGRIIDTHMNSSFRSLRVAITNGHEIEIRFPLYTYTPFRLSPGEALTLSLRKEGVVILRTPLEEDSSPGLMAQPVREAERRRANGSDSG